MTNKINPPNGTNTSRNHQNDKPASRNLFTNAAQIT